MGEIPPNFDIESLEEIVGTRVRSVDIYKTAFTHKSALKQYSVKSSYETLEFLGDAVLSFVITKHLYDIYGCDEKEGFLTKVRTKIVRGKTLSEISEILGLDRFILMDDKAMRNSWNKNPKILEDVFESLIGAIYLDLGIIHVKQFLMKHILSKPIDLDDDNYKDIVMRWCQSNKFDLPVYKVESFTNSQFTIGLYINNKYISSGSDKTKKAAEQIAAQKFVRILQTNINNDTCQGTESHSERICGAEI